MHGEICFDAERHEYWLNGKRLPSVTEIVRFLSVDYISANPALRDAAARRGTAVHEACEAIDYGMDYEIAPEYEGYVIAYKNFLRDYRIKGWTMIEKIIFNDEYAGTLDRYGMINGIPAIVDIKTSSSLHIPQVTAQLTGYSELLSPQEGYHTLYALRLASNGNYQLRECNYSPELWNACRALQRFTDERKKK